MKNLIIITALLALVACTANSGLNTNTRVNDTMNATSNQTDTSFTVCDHVAARGQMCVNAYNPVCAQVDNGIRCIKAPCPSYDTVTYDNACRACKDEKVYSYTQGSCPNNTTRIGGDRDAHGCIGSAGYQWCDPLQQCIRPWETNCTGHLPA